MPDPKRTVDLEARLERLESLLTQRIPPVFDPPPDDWGRWGGWGGWRPIPMPWPQPGDPVPIDLSRLTRSQLKLSLEAIKAQRVRLDAMETMINQQLKEAR
ncbi:MAG: hypothetical protein ACKVZ0_17170 [Gemmatimonadales bacterium]